MGSLLRKKVKILTNPRLQVMHAYQNPLGTSVVIQWLRICLQMQGMQVLPLVQEDPTCMGQPRPCAPTTESKHPTACAPQ